MKTSAARRILATVIAGGALALTACGSGGNSADAEAGDGAAQKPESITYWSMWNEDEPQQQVIAQAIEGFEAGTGIKVNVEWQGRGVTQSLIPALNTNKVPDIADSPFLKLAPVFAGSGQAADLTAVYDSEVDGEAVKDLVGERNLIEGRTVVDGKPWLLPYTVSSDAIWFDAAAYPEFASNPPQTWDEFAEALAQLKADGVAPLAQDGDIGGYNAAWFVTQYIRENGPGSFYSLVEDPSGAGWDAPEVLEAAKRVESLVTNGYFIDGYGASKFPAQQQAWGAHKAALLFNGSWIPAETGTYVDEGFEFASFPMPVNGDKHYARADYVGFVIPEKSANKEWAGQFAASVLQKEYQDAAGVEAKVLPIRSDAEVSPTLQGIKDDIDAAEGLYQQLDGIMFPTYVDTVLFPSSNEFITGKLTAEEYIATLKAATVDYWKNNS
ncbi:ABC transporter substrate-binding protein [Tessaracoccus sp. OS52]|uniref:ABC transporter substrate-binding protein n=1 Tax=Tessaracoccus sp. OS52 TaxID=2886691 RepID=UPI001D0FFD44|nr:ABC transporter substrate-binding protein [Tessaracoccus sp. OS52]MCC2594294.1 ABC transporter substrate-binding protein [Tessaracoccus sp. OS52]